jgi:O-antigen/teichoic acid export membrane protein
MGVGARFLLITLLMGVSLGSDAWIVAHAASLSDVPNYAIPARIFAVIGTAVSVLTMPLWPTSAHAVASGDLEWVTRATRRLSVLTPVVVGLVSVTAAVLGPTLISWWLGGRLQVDPTMLWGFALWNVAQAVVGPVFMVQNAVGVLKPQIIGYAILLLVVPMKWLTVVAIGTTWVPYVTTIAYCLAIWPAAITGYRGAMRLVRDRRATATEGAAGVEL